MNFGDALYQAYNAGILALAIALLAIAIITYPTLRKHTGPDTHHKKK